MLQCPDVIQAVINAYLSSRELQCMYTETTERITAEYAEFNKLAPKQLSLYNPKTLKDVDIFGFDNPMAITELYGFSLRRLGITEFATVFTTDSDKNQFKAVLNHVAQTIEEIEIYGDPGCVIDPIDTVFHRLRILCTELNCIVHAPNLTSYSILGKAGQTIDMASLVYPSLTEFSVRGCHIRNASLLNNLPLSSLQLSRVTLDANLSLNSLSLTTLSLTDMEIPDTLAFPSTLEELTVITTTFDESRIRHLRLRHLTLNVTVHSDLKTLCLSRLESLNLKGFNLNTVLLVNAPYLTKLTMHSCTIVHTSGIQAPLRRVDLFNCTIIEVSPFEGNCWLPPSVVELIVNKCRNASKSVGLLTNLKLLKVMGPFDLSCIQSLRLERLSLKQCDVDDLTPLATMKTLTHLSLYCNTKVNDVMLKHLSSLPLIILDLYGTSINGSGLEYLHMMRLQKLTLPSVNRSYLQHLDLTDCRELWMSMPSDDPTKAHFWDESSHKETPYLSFVHGIVY